MALILIIEDNPALVKILHEMLTTKLKEITVTTASNGKDALAAIENQPPDLILMDIKLPGENGLQLTQTIKKRYPDIRIIVNSNYDFPEYKKAALQFGADEFISKGSGTSEDMIELIQSLFSTFGVDDPSRDQGAQDQKGDPALPG